MLEPRASNCSAIWKASSLVGVRTRVWSRWAEFSRDCRMGSANAPVFPEPVSARPITSFPVGSHGVGMTERAGKVSTCVINIGGEGTSRILYENRHEEEFHVPWKLVYRIVEVRVYTEIVQLLMVCYLAYMVALYRTGSISTLYSMKI